MKWQKGLYFEHSLLLAVVEEGPKEAAVKMVQHSDEKQLIELESWGKLQKGKDVVTVTYSASALNSTKVQNL